MQVAYHGDIDKKRQQDEVRPAAEQVQPTSPNGQSELAYPVKVLIYPKRF